MLHSIYFSAKGTVKLYAEMVGRKIDAKVQEINWLNPDNRRNVDIPKEDALLFTMPVYGGFIPKDCLSGIDGLTGHGTPAIIQAIYGNRHYDYALIQMKEQLEKQGFSVIAAGAFVAEHSIFPTVAAGRPDEKDKAAADEFALGCRDLLANRAKWEGKVLEVPGKTDYDTDSFKGVPFQPDGDESCVGCGQCVEICPRQAILPENPRLTLHEQCISCGACIRVCPTGARNYHGEPYQAARAGFEAGCAVYREPEFYII